MKGKGKDMSKVELTETQKNIIQIRKRMNRRSIEEEKFNGFTKKKMWTYLWIFLFTPYGIYRLFDENNELSFLKDVITEIPLIGTITKVIYYSDKAKNILQNRLENNKLKTQLGNIDNMEAAEIYDNLPYYFALDLKNNVEKSEYPFVFFIDTYEKLVNELDKGQKVDIEAHTKTGSYTNDKGEKVYTTDLVVDKIEYTLEKEKDNQEKTEELEK